MQSRIRQQNNVIYYSIWYQIPYDDYITGRITETFKQDCIDNGVELSTINQYILVMECGPEGISAREIEKLYYWLLQYGVKPQNFRVVFSCIEDVDNLPYPAIVIPDSMINHGQFVDNNIDWQNMSMDYKFVCLMRRASIDRAQFANLLLTTFDQNAIITLGADLEPAENLAELIWPYRYPITFDFTSKEQSRSENNGLPSTDIFYRAPVNLVVESSSQFDTNVWRKIFITEKTYKAFSWHQFPIWYAVPGLVNEVRKLGFDLFDDLFENHYYDQIRSNHVRRQEIINLLQRVVTKNLVKLRQDYWARLESNVELLKYLSKSYNDRSSKLITALTGIQHV
jgi:hypothetical protein